MANVTASPSPLPVYSIPSESKFFTQCRRVSRYLTYFSSLIAFLTSVVNSSVYCQKNFQNFQKNVYFFHFILPNTVYQINFYICFTVFKQLNKMTSHCFVYNGITMKDLTTKSNLILQGK